MKKNKLTDNTVVITNLDRISNKRMTEVSKIMGEFMALQIRKKVEESSITTCIGNGKSYD